MVLVKAGVWHTTVWASQLWHEDLWLEYGTAAPPPAPFVHGSGKVITWPPIRTEQQLIAPEKLKVEVFPQPLPVGMTFEELVAYAYEMLAPVTASEEDLKRVLEPLIPMQQRGDSAEENLRLLLGSLPKAVSHEAAVEEFIRVLRPLVPLKRDDGVDPLRTLRALLSGVKGDREVFENGLRKILKKNKLTYVS